MDFLPFLLHSSKTDWIDLWDVFKLPGSEVPWKTLEVPFVTWQSRTVTDYVLSKQWMTLQRKFLPSSVLNRSSSYWKVPRCPSDRLDKRRIIINEVWNIRSSEVKRGSITMKKIINQAQEAWIWRSSMLEGYVCKKAHWLMQNLTS